MSNVVRGLNSVSGGLASRALLPGITYPMTCNPALTQMHLRRNLRHFSSNVHLTQIDSISFFISIYTYISSRVVSAPGHFCIATLYKFFLYSIVLLFKIFL